VADLRTGLAAGPLDVAAAIAAVGGEECGGTAVFIGTVRQSSGSSTEGRRVVRLDYDAHPHLADEQLNNICAAAQEKWGLTRVLTQHRTGSCDVGEPTVVVACSAPHRAEALEACRYIIDAIKESVPIWKREVYDDGSVWVGAD
jgi:molybdopterin synthase catalytic subunit